MKILNKIFFIKIIRPVVIPIVVINIIGILLWFATSLFVDYQEIYTKLSLSESVEFQTLVFIIITIFEVIMISIIMYRFFSTSSRISIDIKKIIANGENNEVEFKSSLRWDYVENKVNKELEYVVSKTISAFLNTNGGVLLIGLDDNKNILGLRPDYETLKKKNADGFLVNFTQSINFYLGKSVHKYLNITIEEIDKKEFCLVQIFPAKEPIFINHNDHQEFFIRTVSSVQPMGVKDCYEYINDHWKKNK